MPRDECIVNKLYHEKFTLLVHGQSFTHLIIHELFIHIEKSSPDIKIKLEKLIKIMEICGEILCVFPYICYN